MATLGTVCCKLPSGLIVDHGKIVRGADGKPKTSPEGQVLRENVQTRHFVGSNDASALGTGYGMTPNVDVDWFLDWQSEHPDFPPVKQGLIFTNAKPEAATAQAKERKGVKSGFDPIDPKSDPRAPEGVERRTDDK